MKVLNTVFLQVSNIIQYYARQISFSSQTAPATAERSKSWAVSTWYLLLIYKKKGCGFKESCKVI
jgi:hypothetical protein